MMMERHIKKLFNNLSPPFFSAVYRSPPTKVLSMNRRTYDNDVRNKRAQLETPTRTLSALFALYQAILFDSSF